MRAFSIIPAIMLSSPNTALPSLILRMEYTRFCSPFSHRAAIPTCLRLSEPHSTPEAS